MRPAAFVLATLLATPAFAQDAPQATAAPGTATPASSPSVADQIAEYLRSSPPVEIDVTGVSGVTPRDDRKIHGEAAVGVGTGGYRSLYLRSDMPIGDAGRVSVAIEDTRYGRTSGTASGYRFGAGRILGVSREPQGCDLEGMAPLRPLGVLGGLNGRCPGP